MKKSIIYSILLNLHYFSYRYFFNLHYSRFKLKQGVGLIAVDNNDINFFGYYNIPPSNSKGEIIFLKVKKELIRGSLSEPANIMLKDIDENINNITQTKSWNWQQGCMLQWLPKSDDLIIFNDFDDENKQYISKIVDKKGVLIKTFNLPVNNVCKNGNYALSLNYERLASLRPTYGYFNNFKKKNAELLSDDKDGIWYIDLKNGNTKLIITLEQLKSLKYVDSMEGAIHKVNHIDINSTGNRIMFLHRWMGDKGKYMRLITANPDGSDIYILNGDKMTSHCCWLDVNNILSFCYVEGQGKGYFKFNDKTQNITIFNNNMPKVDGHPSVSPDGKYIITDTYPDKSRMSFLFLFDLENGTIHKLGRFFQPLRYNGEMRIDLHPKWSADSKYIFFESGHKGMRRLYRINIK